MKTATGSAAAVAAFSASLQHRLSAQDDASGGRGNINHSVCKWCYPKIDLDLLCAEGKKFGLTSIDLLRPEDFPTLKKHGLTCAMVSNPTVKGPGGKDVGGITRAWNRKENHDGLVKAYQHDIDVVAEAGMSNIICFSGNRDGMDDEEGLRNCAEGLKKIMAHAEKRKVTVSMELLNSKVNHPDYMCDLSKWGVALCEAVGSERFRLLYDIYHMQIMEGDLVATIRRHSGCFSHYHTGGVPGRNEIDDTQEIHYPAVMKAIVETGFKGFVAQEFIPKREDKMGSLRQAVEICDI